MWNPMTSREAMLAEAKGLLEPGEEHNPEYLRGMCELIARCFPLPGIPTDELAQAVQVRLTDSTSTTHKPYSVGRNDGSVPVQYFDTEAEAEAWIEWLERIDPAGVHAGDYYLDAPDKPNTTNGLLDV